MFSAFFLHYAYAYSIDGALVSHHIRYTASVSTAEFMGIFACLSSLTHLSPNSKVLLLTDSLFSLHSLTNLYSTNPLVQRIHLTIYTLNSIGSQIPFAWISSHIGFPEHDAVDDAAEQATLFPQVSNRSRIPAADYKNHYGSFVLQKWYTCWKNQPHNKLLSIEKAPTPCKSSLRGSRREEVVLTRLRVGHTWITHSHLLVPHPQTPAVCPHCQRHCLSVAHFFAYPLVLSLQSPWTFALPLSKPSEIAPMQFLVPFSTSASLSSTLAFDPTTYC